jgi:hypothetical protein
MDSGRTAGKKSSGRRTAKRATNENLIRTKIETYPIDNRNPKL